MGLAHQSMAEPAGDGSPSPLMAVGKRFRFYIGFHGASSLGKTVSERSGLAMPWNFQDTAPV